METDEARERARMQRVNALLEEISALMERGMVLFGDAMSTEPPLCETVMTEIERLWLLREELIALEGSHSTIELFCAIYEALYRCWEVEIKRSQAVVISSRKDKRERRERAEARRATRRPLVGYYTAREAAEVIGVSASRVYAYVEDGALPAYYLGKALLVPQEAIAQFQRPAPGRRRSRRLAEAGSPLDAPGEVASVSK